MRLWPFSRRATVKEPLTVGDAAGFDLGAVRSVLQADVELQHPLTGEPLGAFVTLASPDHPARVRARIEIARQQRDEPSLAAEDAVEQLGESAADYLSRIVLGWRGIRRDGEDLEWTPEAARQLFATEDLRWLVNQLLDQANRTENFIRASALH